MCPPSNLLPLQSSSWCPLWDECVLCVHKAAGGGCYGFVFIRSVNRAEPGTVTTASRCDSLKKKKDFQSQKWLRAWCFYCGFVPFKPRPHQMYNLLGRFSDLQDLGSNIYPDLFFFCCFLNFLHVGLVSIYCNAPAFSPDAALSVDKSLSYGADVYNVNAAALLLSAYVPPPPAS